MITKAFEELENTSGRKDKELILKKYDSPLLRKALEYTYNPYKQYHVVKFPSANSDISVGGNESIVWNEFFNILDMLDQRKVTGHDAVELVGNLINSQEDELSKWMRRVVERHLNVGITSNTINKAFPKLIPSFKVQLAHKFEEKRIKGHDLLALEPKLDGVRCIAIVKNGHAVLYSRNGKNIGVNYQDTIVENLNKLAGDRFPDNVVFDGELMGSDFTATVSQIHRKKGNTNVLKHHYHIFDWMPYEDWTSQKSTLTCQETREKLEDMALETHSEYLRVVHRDVVAPDQIKPLHDLYVSQGYEGAMIKTLDTYYKFGRGHNVMKLKDFHDIDLEVVRFEEGSGKYNGVLGAIIVKHGDVLVHVGSGFSDADREDIWEHRSKFRGMIAEIRYQEETPDGSLRFPTFRGWRPDKK